MHALDLITPDIPPLRPHDDIKRALDWMEEFKVMHLPVVNEKRLVGLVKDTDLMECADAHALCLLYTSPSPRDRTRYRMPSSA